MHIAELLKEDDTRIGDIAGYTGGGGIGQALAGVNMAVNQRDDLDAMRAGAAEPASVDPAAPPGEDVPATSNNTDPAGRAYDFFVSKGLSAAQSAGIVGNLQAESGPNLNIRAVGDGGQAMGIAQWHPDRRANFQRAFNKRFARSTFEDQLEFIWWELNNTERSAMSRLRRTTTATQAASVFDQYYERSSGEHRAKRVQYANAIYRTALA